MKPICVPCRRFYRIVKTGRSFVEAMPVAERAKPGNAEPEKWQPYKLWSGDEWQCPDCTATIIVGTGREPYAEHYQPQFAELVKQFGATLQINDC